MDKTLFSNFYKKTREDRIAALLKAQMISEKDALFLLKGSSFSHELAGSMVENQLTAYELPLGIALNFLIDRKEYVLPYAVEEPSVVAAASSAAKIIRQSGGFSTSLTSRRMIGQVALKEIPDATAAVAQLTSHKTDIIERANRAYPSIVKRGGGADGILIRPIAATDESPEFIVVHVLIDTQEAMGANIINTMMETITPYIEELSKGTALMSILSNYATECLATASCHIPVHLLKRGKISGEEVRDRIIEAYQLAYADPYRAVTHNKGIMNGIDAIVVASGNDWRAIEAGAHAYAARSGQYRSLSTWKKAANGDLSGTLTLPLPVGFVGGSIGIHPTAQFSHRLMGLESARELESVIVSAGLAQNFSALKALVTEGIQKGHMGLQAKSLAIGAGASGKWIDIVAEKLKSAKNMNLETAQQLLAEAKKRE